MGKDDYYEESDKIDAKVYGTLLLICIIMFAVGAGVGFTIGKTFATPDQSSARFEVESTPPIERSIR